MATPKGYYGPSGNPFDLSKAAQTMGTQPNAVGYKAPLNPNVPAWAQTPLMGGSMPAWTQLPTYAQGGTPYTPNQAQGAVMYPKPKPPTRRDTSGDYTTPVGYGSQYPAGVTSQSAGAAPFTFFQNNPITPVMTLPKALPAKAAGSSSPWGSKYKGWGGGGGGGYSWDNGGYSNNYVPNWAWNLVNWNVG
jgi:hypothetical protein